MLCCRALRACHGLHVCHNALRASHSSVHACLCAPACRACKHARSVFTLHLRLSCLFTLTCLSPPPPLPSPPHPCSPPFTHPPLLPPWPLAAQRLGGHPLRRQQPRRLAPALPHPVAPLHGPAGTHRVQRLAGPEVAGNRVRLVRKWDVNHVSNAVAQSQVMVQGLNPSYSCTPLCPAFSSFCLCPELQHSPHLSLPYSFPSPAPPSPPTAALPGVPRPLDPPAPRLPHLPPHLHLQLQPLRP